MGSIISEGFRILNASTLHPSTCSSCQSRTKMIVIVHDFQSKYQVLQYHSHFVTGCYCYVLCVIAVHRCSFLFLSLLAHLDTLHNHSECKRSEMPRFWNGFSVNDGNINDNSIWGPHISVNDGNLSADSALL